MLKNGSIKVSALIKKMFDLFVNLMRSGGKWAFQSSLDFSEMIKSCEGVALDLFDERKQGYSSYWVDEFISAEN